MGINDEKKYYLKKEGCININASNVKADIFNDGNNFFDKNDIVQTRYEMIRSVEKNKFSINAASDMYGVSRISFYKTKKAFDAYGIQGLFPKKKGPKAAYKLTPDVIRFLESEIKSDSQIKSDKLAKKVLEKFGYSVHARTIEKALLKGKKKHSKGQRD